MPSPHQEKIKMINNKVALVEPDRNALLKTDLQSSIAKLEEVWEGHRDAGDIEKNMGILIIFKKRNGDDVDMSLYIYTYSIDISSMEIHQVTHPSMCPC
jgi:hypothetical protein